MLSQPRPHKAIPSRSGGPRSRAAKVAARQVRKGYKSISHRFHSTCTPRVRMQALDRCASVIEVLQRGEV